MYDWTIYDVRLDDLRCTIEMPCPQEKATIATVKQSKLQSYIVNS